MLCGTSRHATPRHVMPCHGHVHAQAGVRVSTKATLQKGGLPGCMTEATCGDRPPVAVVCCGAPLAPVATGEACAPAVAALVSASATASSSEAACRAARTRPAVSCGWVGTAGTVSGRTAGPGTGGRPAATCILELSSHSCSLQSLILPCSDRPYLRYFGEALHCAQRGGRTVRLSTAQHPTPYHVMHRGTTAQYNAVGAEYRPSQQCSQSLMCALRHDVCCAVLGCTACAAQQHCAHCPCMPHR